MFDFLLNWNIATKPGLLILIGLGYAAIYYFLFRFVIRKWNLRTPGRDEDDDNSSMEGSHRPADGSPGEGRCARLSEHVATTGNDLTNRNARRAPARRAFRVGSRRG